MAGGGSSKDLTLAVPRLDGAATEESASGELTVPEEKAPRGPLWLPHCCDDDAIQVIDDDDAPLACHDEDHVSEQLIQNEARQTRQAEKQLAPSPILPRNLKRMSKYYQKQMDLLESYCKDSTAIYERKQRKKQMSVQQHNVELEKMLINKRPIVEKVSFECTSTNSEGKVSAVTVRQESFRSEEDKPSSSLGKAARWLAMTTLIANVALVVAKTAAAFLSGSLSIVSSLVDSAVDITSGLVIWLTARAIKKRDPYMYPRGRTRLEPIALIIVSVIMGVASVQMIVQSVESVIHGTVQPRVDIISLCIMVVTVFIKFVLMMFCKAFSSDPSVAVLAQDHRNDCVSNTVAIVCAWIAANYWLYFDPFGAIIVSIYIAITWFLTGKEHLAMLSGKSAEPDFINRIIKICMEHDKRINYIDTVYVYHFGTRFLVEVHIVLDPDMTLRESHDLSETLQTNIESLEEVERAFVHCDYEYDHLPTDEHKVV